jgi:hypothetical protein
MRPAPPFSFPSRINWDEKVLTIATPRTSRTAKNLIPCRLGASGAGPNPGRPHHRGPGEEIPIGIDARLEDEHAKACGLDPRTLAEEHVYLRIAPHEMQPWHEADELEGRQLMREGRWLD